MHIVYFIVSPHDSHNVHPLHLHAGYGVETVSRGRYAEVLSSSRSFSPDEAAYFSASARAAYTSFTAKAAASRALPLHLLVTPHTNWQTYSQLALHLAINSRRSPDPLSVLGGGSTLSHESHSLYAHLTYISYSAVTSNIHGTEHELLKAKYPVMHILLQQQSQHGRRYYNLESTGSVRV